MQDYQLTTPRGNPAVMAARDQTSDLAVLGSTYAGVASSGLVDEYRLAGLYVTGHFVDVGAHIGSVGIAVLIDNPEARVTFVEPVPENLAVLRANLAANGVADRATVIEGAVGTNAITYLFEGDELATTNRYIGNLTRMPKRGSKRIQVRRVTMSDLLPADVLKMDCEGGEWALLADPGLLTVPVILGEYHGSPGAQGVLVKLNDTHRVEFTDVMATTGTFFAVAR